MLSYNLFTFFKEIIKRKDLLASSVCNKTYGKVFSNKQVSSFFKKIMSIKRSSFQKQQREEYWIFYITSLHYLQAC